MSAVTETSAAPVLSDAALLDRVRAGDKQAYGVLWDRHHSAGLAAARAVTSAFDAEDLVSESFVRVMRAIQSGNGPTVAFRPYLVATVRSVAARWGAKPAEITPDEFEAVDPSTSDEAFSEKFDQGLTVQAFNTLPTRWQEVLWYTEAEQRPPREVAALLGIKPNAVSALAKRAREGLRHAWVQAHVASVPEGSECRWTIDRLAAQTRKSLPARDQDRLDAHLDECDRCPLAAAEMTEAKSRLGVLILIGFLGAGAATAYGAAVHPAVASAATVGAGAAGGAAATKGGAAAKIGALLAKPGWARNAAIGGGSAVAVGAVAAGIAFAASAGGPTPVKTEAPAAVSAPVAATTPAAAPAPVPPVPKPAAPKPAATPAAPPPKPAAPVVAPQPVVAPPTPASRPAPAPQPARSSAPTSKPTPSSTPTPTPAPTHVPAQLTATADSGGGLYYPIVSGTGDPGATVTISNGSNQTSVTVGSHGSYSTGQLTWVAVGSSSLTVTQKPISGASSQTTASYAALTPPSSVSAPLGAVTVAGAPNATVLVSGSDALGVTQGAVQISLDETGSGTGTLPLLVTQVTARYVSGSGRFGPAISGL